LDAGTCRCPPAPEPALSERAVCLLPGRAAPALSVRGAQPERGVACRLPGILQEQGGGGALLRQLPQALRDRQRQPAEGTPGGRARPATIAHLLAQMGRAEDIRRSFFAENPEEPGLQFKLESYLLDSNMRRAEFRLG